MHEVHKQRDRFWKELQPLFLPDGTCEIGAKARLHRGQRGFFRDGGRYTFSVLSNGGYEDEEDSAGALYHFPQSHQPSHDQSDIAAAEQCLLDGVPIFYIRRVAVGPARYRIDYPAWITAVDHASERLFIEFRSTFKPLVVPNADSPFLLREEKTPYNAVTTQRKGRARFRMACFLRYGPKGALCDSTEDTILVACHLFPYADDGSDDARNGLILSANHHLLFDKGLIQFSDDYLLLIREDVGRERFRAFGIVHLSLHHLPNYPAAEALRAARTRIHKQNTYKVIPPEWQSGIMPA